MRAGHRAGDVLNGHVTDGIELDGGQMVRVYLAVESRAIDTNRERCRHLQRQSGRLACLRRVGHAQPERRSQIVLLENRPLREGLGGGLVWAI